VNPGRDRKGVNESSVNPGRDGKGVSDCRGITENRILKEGGK